MYRFASIKIVFGDGVTSWVSQFLKLGIDPKTTFTVVEWVDLDRSPVTHRHPTEFWVPVGYPREGQGEWISKDIYGQGEWITSEELFLKTAYAYLKGTPYENEVAALMLGIK